MSTPQSTPLVLPVVPDLVGNAFVPGPPCPCGEVEIFPAISSRNVRVSHAKCTGLLRRTTTTTYEKGETNPFNEETEPEAWQAWENAWPTIVHVLVEGLDGDTRSTTTTFNINGTAPSSEFVPCPVFETLEEEWTPGQLDANPGSATYTSSSDVDDESMPGVGAPYAGTEFEGDFEITLGSGYTIARNADDTESSLFKTQWRWDIDLTGWPTSQPWPPGYVYRGTIIWEQVTSEYSADSYDPLSPGSPLTTGGVFLTETFEITAEAPHWQGDVREDVPSGIAENRVRVLENITPSAFVLLLPFP